MEKEFIAWLEERFQSSSKFVVAGPGDDACILALGQGPVVITTDTVADGVHFRTKSHSFDQIGYKAMAVNLSDIAAMGARPIAATINLMCPVDCQLDDLKELYRGFARAAEMFETPIVGGDTNRWEGGLVVGATVIGVPFENAKTEFWRMSGGKPGDKIIVSGTLGGSIAGKHIDFIPGIELAKQLMENYNISAATDITDSLAIDLAALADKSNCGFVLNRDALPISRAADELSKHSEFTPLEHALYDGEDFELILCASSDEASKILADSTTVGELTMIGELNDSCRFTITGIGKSTEQSLEIKGYVH